MNSAQWVAAVVILPATAFLWVRISPLADLLTQERPGPRTRRLILRRGFLAMGLWQWSVGLFLIASGAGSMSIALFGVGLYMVLVSRYPQAIGL